jgi:AcrR family transcriptional regulator
VRDEAGVSTGAIYTYFPNKEAMMRAILERARDDRQRQLATTGGESTVDPSVVLLQWAAAIFSAQGLHAARVDVNLWAEALRNPRVHKLAHGALKDAVTAVSAVVAPRLPSIEAARGVQPDSVASVLVALFLGLEVQTALGLSLEASEVVRVLSALFADYIPAPEPKRPAAKTGRRTRRRS